MMLNPEYALEKSQLRSCNRKAVYISSDHVALPKLPMSGTIDSIYHHILFYKKVLSHVVTVFDALK
jgi:hypothetical protein